MVCMWCKSDVCVHNNNNKCVCGACGVCVVLVWYLCDVWYICPVWYMCGDFVWYMCDVHVYMYSVCCACDVFVCGICMACL